MRQIRHFNKKTFKPQYVSKTMRAGQYTFESSAPYSQEDRRILDQWRNAGWTRSCAYRSFGELGNGKTPYYNEKRLKLEKLRSTAYQMVYSKTKKRSVIVDAGCGKSPDTFIALDHDGFKKAYRIDLYDFPHWDRPTINMIADVSKKIPKIKSGSVDVVLSQAMLDLLKADERDSFYKEAHRWLRKGGLLAVYIVNLQLGFGFDIIDERDAVEKLGFSILEKKNAAFVAQKL